MEFNLSKHFVPSAAFVYVREQRRHMSASTTIQSDIPVSILRKSISGRHRPVRVADGPMTARCRFTQNASWDGPSPRK